MGNTLYVRLPTCEVPNHCAEVRRAEFFRKGGAACEAVEGKRWLLQTLPVGGHAVIGSFALDGPEKCSGLEVRRYDGPMLALELGPQFALLKSESEMHVTPWGKQQSFQFSLLKRV